MEVRGLGTKLLDDAFPLDFGFSEIDEEAEREPLGSQVIGALRSVFVGQAIYAFQFDYENISNKNVREVFADRLAPCRLQQKKLALWLGCLAA